MSNIIQTTIAACVNVRDFGAKGDGTDATSAIQAAIDSLPQPQGGTVYLPPGLYLVSRAIDLKDNIHLKGSGIAATTIRLRLPDKLRANLSAADYHHNWASVLRIAGKHGVTVSHLHIDGNKQLIDGSQGANPYLVARGYPDGGLQSGIAITGWPSYVSLTPTRHSENCVIEACWVENCVYDGISVHHAHHIQIRDCACHDNGILPPAPDFNYETAPGATMPFGIALLGGTAYCIVERCSAFRNPHAGILVGTANSLHHQIRYCETDAIDISHFVQIDVPDPTDPTKTVKTSAAVPFFLTIVGCTVDNSQQPDFRTSPSACIELGTASHVTIQDCHLIVKYNAGLTGHARRVGTLDHEDFPPLDKQHNPRGNVFINNRINQVAGTDPAPGSGINLGDQHDFLVSGNTIAGEFTIGIMLLRCKQGIVSSNNMMNQDYWASTPQSLPGTGIGLYGAQEITITANSIRGFNVGVRETEYGVVTPDSNIVLGNILKNNGQQPIAGIPGANSVYTTNIT